MDYGKLISFSVAVLLTSGVLVLVAPPAFSKERPVVVVADPDRVTRRVTYADLNLTSASGEAALNRRVGGAIRSLCLEATANGDSNFPFNTDSRKCRTSAWNQAHPQIARAVQRSRDIASTGVSPIVAAAITIDLTK